MIDPMSTEVWLEHDEVVLWSGKPVVGKHRASLPIGSFLIHLVAVGIGLFMMRNVEIETDATTRWVIAIGIVLLVLGPLLRNGGKVDRRLVVAEYIVTDQRIIIVGGLSEAVVKELDLASLENINRIDHGKGIGDIIFGHGRAQDEFDPLDPPRILSIDRADEVYRIIMDARDAARDRIAAQRASGGRHSEH